MATVRRVRKQLAGGTRPALSRGPATAGLSLAQRVEALQRPDHRGQGAGAAVVLATGRAIDKGVAVASWVASQSDCRVEVRTRTVGTIDDVIVQDGHAEHGQDGEDGQDQTQPPLQLEDHSRLRWVSAVELCIRLR